MLEDNAFPTYFNEDSIRAHGLSKREYYAAIALQGLVAKDDDPLVAALLQHRAEEFDLTKLEWFAQLKARAAVIYAEALEAELNR